MRVIKVPLSVIEQALSGPAKGVALQVPVKVDWPELQLTERQILANAVALANGQRDPFPDQSIFVVEVPYTHAALARRANQ